MVWGTPPDGVPAGEQWDVGHVPLIVAGAALVGLGLALPEPVRELMDQAVTVLLRR